MLRYAIPSTTLELQNELHRAQLYFMLFVVTGCTGGPLQGAHLVECSVRENLGAVFRTPEAAVDLDASDIEEDLTLGLVRIVGSRLKGGSAYRLAATPQGTEIGSLSLAPDAVTDVEADVSRLRATSNPPVCWAAKATAGYKPANKTITLKAKEPYRVLAPHGPVPVGKKGSRGLLP